MNIPGGHPPPKFWRFLALGAVNWRSCFWLDFLDAILHFWRKPAWLKICHDVCGWKWKCICSWRVLESRWSTLIVEDIPIFQKLPKWFFILGGKWLENDLKRSWEWRCKQSFASARTFRQSIVKSNQRFLHMFCRRHSSEGVDAKFGSTLPKDFAVH